MEHKDTCSEIPDLSRFERVCRICHGHELNDPEMGRLISPCKCKGTMKYVHLGCLNSWRKVSKRKESFWKCDSCGYKYAFKRALLANCFLNELMTQSLTILIFVLLVFVSGYMAKLVFYIVSEEDDEYSVLKHGNFVSEIGIHRGTASVSLWKPDWDHMVIGLYSVGALGFFHVFISFFRNPFGPFPNLRISSRGSNDSASYFVFGFFILVGVLKTLYAIYRSVKKISQRFLARLETAVLEVSD